MLGIIPSNHRHFSDAAGLRTCRLFSIASSFGPQNIYFGALRVFDQDILEQEDIL